MERTTAELFDYIEYPTINDPQAMIQTIQQLHSVAQVEREHLEHLKGQKKMHEEEAGDLLAKLLGRVISGPDGQGCISWEDPDPDQ